LNQINGKRRSPRRRRFLACPAHAEEALLGNGQKYFLHLLTSEQLQQRGMAARKARLVIQAYPVLVLSNEWLENLYCRRCEQLRWCHVVRRLDGSHQVSWAPRELWQQVAHVDPSTVNPSVSEFSRREARLRARRLWGQL
jgi:hypothetical protein